MWKCPNCATENSDWVKKCEKCQYKPEREKVSASQVLKTSAIVALVLACVVALTVFFGVKQNAGKDSGEVVYVEINDPGLEKAVRVTLNKPEGQLTQEELNEIALLNAEKCGVESLEELTKLPNIQNLYLQGNHLTDISNVRVLKELRYLNIDENQVSDISVVSELDNLLAFSANNNQISDISPLAGKVQILRIYLENNQITDITPLTDLRKLMNVYLDGNDITDFTPMLNKPYLKELHVRGGFYGGNFLQELIESSTAE